MPIYNQIYDNGLLAMSAANRLDICSAEPTTYTQATSTFSRGNKISPSIGSPAARSPGGRRVTVAAITDGTSTSTGAVTWVALTDTVNSRLLVTQALTASKDVANGSTFTLPAFDIGFTAVGGA